MILVDGQGIALLTSERGVGVGSSGTYGSLG